MKKTTENNDTTKASAEKVPLGEGLKAKLDVILSKLKGYDGTVTGAVFDRGDCFIAAREITKQYFTAWLKESTNYSVRMAYNYAEISSVLGADRKRYIEVGAGVAVMTELLTASLNLRNDVLERLAKGEKVTVAMVQKLKLAELGLEPKKPVPACDTAGAPGLRRLADEKLKATIGKFLIAVASVMDGIEKLGAHARLGKSMQRRDIVVSVVTPAKLARTYLTHVALPLVEEQRSATPGGFKGGSLWSEIDEMITLLASEADLTKVDDLLDYLREEAHPLLSTVLDPAPTTSSDRVVVDAPPLAPNGVEHDAQTSEVLRLAKTGEEATDTAEEDPDAPPPETA